MDPLMVDSYRFFAYHADLFRSNVIAFNLALDIQTILEHSIGYGYEDREELLEFLLENMMFLRDKEY